jgi:hypothetical protein
MTKGVSRDCGEWSEWLKAQFSGRAGTSDRTLHNSDSPGRTLLIGGMIGAHLNAIFPRPACQAACPRYWRYRSRNSDPSAERL